MSKIQEFVSNKDVIPIEITHGSILNIHTNNVTSFTHGFHKYPAKFIPQIPKWAIEKYLNGNKRKTILDPFCGSGTTMVEALLFEHNGVGIDIDPFSSLISKVKTTSVNLKELKEISNWLIKSIRGGKGEFKPDCETIRHWFNEDSLNKLSIIRTQINLITDKFGEDKSVKDIQELLLICFSSILRRVSNADNESQKTYVSHTKIKEPEEVYTLFFQQLEYFKERITRFTNSVNSEIKAEIICTNSTDSLDKTLNNQKIDLVITSPPYIKAIDYIYNQMVELFWIGDIFNLQTQTKQNSTKKTYIGTKYFHKVEFKDYSPYSTILGINKLDEKLQQVYDKDKKNGHKHSFITFKYFTNMEKHFAEMAKFLTYGTPYIMVIGNSSVSDIYFDTADYLIEIAERNGFEIRNKWGYKIKNRYMRFDRKGRGGIIEVDWVLDLHRK
jgi:DNA modification methylase